MRFLSFALIVLTSTAFLKVLTAQDVYVDNVVIVLDGSRSMEGRMDSMAVSKIQAAKTSIFKVMKTLPQSTHVGLIAFGDNVTQWIYPLGPRDDAALFNALKNINPGGGTPLGEYMKYGADALLKAREKQYGYGSYRLLIVTDGEANDDNLVNRFARDIISRGITVDVIGVNMQNDHTLAALANSYRRANDPASLQTAIQQVFAEVENKADTGADKSDFSELANIPDEIILCIIDALNDSDNQPIGFGSQTDSPKSSPTGSISTFNWILFILIATGLIIRVFKS